MNNTNLSRTLISIFTTAISDVNEKGFTLRATYQDYLSYQLASLQKEATTPFNAPLLKVLEDAIAQRAYTKKKCTLQWMEAIQEVEKRFGTVSTQPLVAPKTPVVVHKGRVEAKDLSGLTRAAKTRLGPVQHVGLTGQFLKRITAAMAALCIYSGAVAPNAVLAQEAPKATPEEYQQLAEGFNSGRKTIKMSGISKTYAAIKARHAKGATKFLESALGTYSCIPLGAPDGAESYSLSVGASKVTMFLPKHTLSYTYEAPNSFLAEEVLTARMGYWKAYRLDSNVEITYTYGVGVLSVDTMNNQGDKVSTENLKCYKGQYTIK